MDLISHHEHEGLKILLKNKKYQNLVNMMEDQQTKQFIAAYMNDITDAHVLLMMIKLYLEIEGANPHLNVFEKILMMDKVLKNKDDRRHVVSLFDQWRNNSLIMDH